MRGATGSIRSPALRSRNVTKSYDRYVFRCSGDDIRKVLARWTGLLATLGVACLCLGAGSAHAAQTWWTPPQQLTWYWQRPGPASAEPTLAVDVDGFGTSAAAVAALHARGQRAICYIDA